MLKLFEVLWLLDLVVCQEYYLMLLPEYLDQVLSSTQPSLFLAGCHGQIPPCDF